MSTLINGEPADSVPSSDRGLHYGDGVFETISCVDSKPRWLDLHLLRLVRGCERLGIAFRALELLRAEISELAVAPERCIVKVIVTRGSARRRGYAPSGDELPMRMVARYPWPPSPQHDGLRVGLSDVRLGENPRLACIKHLNRLEQVLAQKQAQERDLHEVLLQSYGGALVCGSACNLFLLREDALVTPALDQCGIEGIMRSRVLWAATQLHRPVQVRAVELSELVGAQEVFLTNVRWGVQAVRWLEGKELAQRGLAQQLRELIDATPT